MRGGGCCERGVCYVRGAVECAQAVPSSHDVPAALVFVYDYHAGADTLLSRHFPASVAEGLHGPAVPVAEDILWRYILQLSSALTAVHGSGLAARFIHASKILVVGNHRQV